MGIEQNQSSVTKRRQFMKKAGAGVAVSSLPMKSVWGACSVSGVMSGNLSQTGGGTGDACGTIEMPNGGRSPGSWFQGNTWTPGHNSKSAASVFPQLRYGLSDDDECLLTARIEAMRTHVKDLIKDTELTLSEAAAKYIYDSDSAYDTSPTLLAALSGTDLPSNRKNILKHTAVVYLNVYYGLYNGVNLPLNHAAAQETAQVVMAKMVEMKQNGGVEMTDSQLGYTDGHSRIIQSTFESEFSDVFDEACSGGKDKEKDKDKDKGKPGKWKGR